MIQLGKSDIGLWVSELRRNPDNVLRVGDVVLDGDLWTISELLSLYDPEGSTRVTLNGMARELRRAGFATACRNKQIKLPTGASHVMYVIRHEQRWAASIDPLECARHYVKTRNVKGAKF